MKVVAIQGSPHRGNTHDRVEAFGRELEGLGGVEFEHIPLRDVRVQPCRGCFRCFIQGEGACPIDDDVASLERSMRGADAVVFATPVYSMHVSYLLKTFIDRLAYTFHRPRYFGRYAVGLAVTGAVGQNEALAYIRSVAGAWGFEHAGYLAFIDPPRGTPLPRTARGTDRTAEVAAALHRLMRERPARRLSVRDHLMFHAMRAVYSRMERYSPADYAYWKENGWLEQGTRWFTEDARAGIVKSLYPRLIAWIMGRSMDREFARIEARGSRDTAGPDRESDV